MATTSGDAVENAHRFAERTTVSPTPTETGATSPSAAFFEATMSWALPAAAREFVVVPRSAAEPSASVVIRVKTSASDQTEESREASVAILDPLTSGRSEFGCSARRAGRLREYAELAVTVRRIKIEFNSSPRARRGANEADGVVEGVGVTDGVTDPVPVELSLAWADTVPRADSVCVRDACEDEDVEPVEDGDAVVEGEALPVLVTCGDDVLLGELRLEPERMLEALEDDELLAVLVWRAEADDDVTAD